MEGSVANQGGQQSAGGEGESQQDQGQAVTSEQFQGMSQALEEMRGILQAQPWQQQAADDGDAGGEPDEPAIDLSFLESEQGYDTQNIADGLSQAIREAAERQVQQHVSPLQEQIGEMRRAEAARDLVAEFPELDNESAARELVETSAKYAQQIGSRSLRMIRRFGG